MRSAAPNSTIRIFLMRYPMHLPDEFMPEGQAVRTHHEQVCGQRLVQGGQYGPRRFAQHLAHVLAAATRRNPRWPASSSARASSSDFPVPVRLRRAGPDPGPAACCPAGRGPSRIPPGVAALGWPRLVHSGQPRHTPGRSAIVTHHATGPRSISGEAVSRTEGGSVQAIACGCHRMPLLPRPGRPGGHFCPYAASGPFGKKN